MSNFDQYTIAELRTLIRNAHVVLDLPAATGTSKLRKAELVEAMVDLQARLDANLIAAGIRTEDGPLDMPSANDDEHTSIAGPDGLGQRTDDPMDTMIVNGAPWPMHEVDGAAFTARWLALPVDKRSMTVTQERYHLAATPSPLRHYQSAMEGLTVIDAHIDQEVARTPVGAYPTANAVGDRDLTEDQVEADETMITSIRQAIKGFADAAAAAREMATAAHEVGKAAYAHKTAVVRVAGRVVRGKVVDTVLRAPDASGGGRVLLVVEHAAPEVTGRHRTRTLHRLADTKFVSA